MKNSGIINGLHYERTNTVSSNGSIRQKIEYIASLQNFERASIDIIWLAYNLN